MRLTGIAGAHAAIPSSLKVERSPNLLHRPISPACQQRKEARDFLEQV